MTGVTPGYLFGFTLLVMVWQELVAVGRSLDLVEKLIVATS